MTRSSRAAVIIVAIGWWTATHTGGKPTRFRTRNRIRIQAGQSWGQLPAGRPYGNTSAVHVDARGVVWVADKCASTTCTGRTEDPILAFDPSGKLLPASAAACSSSPTGSTWTGTATCG